jgi:CheY-like chemotaxis protein
MPHRNEERTPLRLTTLVWGMDGNGHVFMEQVQTLDISPMGARLKGMTHTVAPGAILGVQNGDYQGRFEVVWVGEDGTSREGQVGVRCVQVGQNIRKNILYIDDQEHELERRRSMLEAFGYGVHTAMSGREAFEELAGFHFHGVVLDHPLPDIDTTEFIEQVQHKQPQAKTVILSAFPGKLPERALAIADAFVHKGENHNRLVQTMEQLIGPGSTLKWPITRTVQRYAVVVPLTVRVLRSGVNATLHGKSTDLSEGGVGVQVESGEFIPGEIVTVEFSLPTLPNPMRIYGTVRHRKLDDYGIEFVNMSHDHRQAIRDLCDVLVPMDIPQ